MYQIIAYRAGYPTISIILKQNELSNSSRLLNASVKITFSKLQVKANFVFHWFNLFHNFRTQMRWKRCLCFAILSCSEKIWNVFEIVLEKCEVFVQKSLSLKKYLKEKIRRHLFCCLCVNLPTVKIWGQSDKFPMSFSFLQCPLQVKKLIWENSAKCVNQMGNFYMYIRPKRKTAIPLPIFNFFQWFLFYIY